MSWTVKKFFTNSYGIKSIETDVTDILGGFTLRQTLGDEFFIKSSEIEFSHRTAFSLGGGHNWLAFYFNDALIDVFYLEAGYTERNVKQPYLYRSRLKSIQGIFYDNIAEKLIAYSEDAHNWNSYIPDAELVIDGIKLTPPALPPGLYSNRAGYSLGDLLAAMHQGTDFYYVDAVSFGECPAMTEDDLPVIYRGQSVPASDTSQQKTDWTFEDFGVTWLDLFKLAIFGWNAFVRVRPKILDVSGTDHLAVDVQIVPKDALASYSPTTPQWLDAKYIPKKYFLDAIHLSSSITDEDGTPSFEYLQGDLKSKNILEKEITIADPDSPMLSYDEVLYWSAGDYDPVTEKYDILDGSDNNKPYFGSGLVEPWYAGMITSGNGYTGKIRYAGECAGGTLYDPFGGVIHVNNLTIKRDAGGAVADVEGLVIA